jgi:hypothetical protein
MLKLALGDETISRTQELEAFEWLLNFKSGMTSAIELSLCLTKHHAMKTYWWNGAIAPRILDLGTTWR